MYLKGVGGFCYSNLQLCIHTVGRKLGTRTFCAAFNDGLNNGAYFLKKVI